MSVEKLNVNEMVTFDANRAQAAFEAVRADIESIAPQGVRPVTAKVREAAIVALRVADRLREEPYRSDLQRLPKSVFDHERAGQLSTYAYAAWHAREKLMDVLSKGNKVPADVVEEAAELRRRMLRVVSYHLPKLTALDSIRSGKGYVDLASDLSRLAKIYEANAEVLQRDTHYFDAADMSRANQLFEQIVGHLRNNGNAEYKHWVDMQARAFTALRKVYDLVRVAVRLIYHGNEARLSAFPSLIGAARKSGRRAAVQSDTVPEIDLEVPANEDVAGVEAA